MKPEVDVKVDYAFKKVFGSPENTTLLKHLLHGVLTEELDHPLTALEIVNPFTGQEAFDEKLSILDIKARDRLGRSFNVEMQMLLSRPLLPPRLLYYWAGLFRDSLHEGKEYTQLRPTFTICFLDGVLYDHADFHHAFRLRSGGQPSLLFSPLCSLHVVELPKFRKNAAELASALDLWCFFLRHSADLDTDQLPAALDLPEIHRALEVLTVLTENEIERQRYLDRRKAQLDALSFTRVFELEKQALELEKLQGRQEGRQEGELIGQVQAYEQVLKITPTPASVLEALGPSELQELLSRLKAQLGLRQP